MGDNLDGELARGVVCDIVSSGGMVVTTPEAVKEAQSADESTRIIKEILANGAIDDPSQWIKVGPDFYNVRPYFDPLAWIKVGPDVVEVRSELIVLHEVL